MPQKDPAKRRAYYYAHREERRAYREANREKISARSREYSVKNKDAKAERNKSWRLANAEEIEDRRMRRVFGISLQRYRTMLADQHGGCAICGTPPQNGRRLDIDHDHLTSVVRGLLCWDCNVGVGKLGDSVLGLEQALAYLKRAHVDLGDLV